MSKKTIIALIVSLLAALCMVACTGPVKTQLAAPTATLDGNVVSWQAVDNADSYDVKVGNNPAVNVKGTSYTIDNVTEEGSYDVYVTAKSNGDYRDSVPSNKVTYVYDAPEAILAPVVTIDKNVITWAAVEKASEYEIYVGEEKKATVTETTYTFDITEKGEYQVTVVAKTTEEGYVDSQKSEAVTLVVNDPVLSWNTEEVKTLYYLDEGATTLDLTGLTASYTDIYGNETEVTLADFEVGEYALTEAGEIEVDFTYAGITKTLFVEVKERTIADLTEYTEVLFEYSEAGKYAVEGVTAAVDMKGANLLNADGTLNLSMGQTLAKTDGNFVVYTVAYFIDTIDEFKAIANDLDGYYVLQKDLDFENGWQSVIGAAPIYNSGNGNKLAVGDDEIPAGTENSDKVQNGIAFTGTLDGRGYTVKNYKIGREAGWKADAYGVAMFGWLGETGAIKNLTLRNVSISGGKYSALLVGYNQGLIENIFIEESCALRCAYSEGAAISAYDYGRIKNVVSQVGTYQGFNGNTLELPLAVKQEVQEEVINYSTVENGFVLNIEDNTAVLGKGWKYFEGVGTVLINPDYVYIATKQTTMAIGEKLYLNDVYVNGDALDCSFYGAGGADLTFGWDGETGSHFIAIKDLTSYTVAVGAKITVVLHSLNWNSSSQIIVEILAPNVTGYEKVTETLSVTEGLDIDLTAIEIKENYSDLTSKTVNPIKVEGYDKTAAVGSVQTVKAFYGEGENDYVEIKVTTVQKQILSIAIDTSSTFKTSYEVGEALDLTGAKLVVNYNNNTSETVAITGEMLDNTTYDLATAGSYNVAVNYGGMTTTFGIIVQSGEVVITSISATLASTRYKLGYTMTEADLEGSALTVNYSDGSAISDAKLTLEMLTYDFSTLGQTEITVAYNGVTTKIAVEVYDYAVSMAAEKVKNDVYYSATEAIDVLTPATLTLTYASGKTETTTEVNPSYELKSGEMAVTYSYKEDETITATLTFSVWYKVTATSDWTAIQNNLAGYYTLDADLDFENAIITSIAKQPVNLANDETTCLVENPATANVQAGIPFTGKFVGNGHKIKNFKFDGTSFDGAGFGLSLFGYIGQGAEVGGFTLSGATVTSKNQTGFVATVNEGTVKNVVIDETCKITAEWGTAGVVVFNFGTGVVENVVSYVTTVSKRDDASVTWPLSVIKTDYHTAATKNCAVSGSAEFTALTQEALGAGWVMLENGPVYRGTCMLVVMDKTVTIGEVFHITVYADEEYSLDFVQVWGTGYGKEFYPSWKGNGQFEYVATAEFFTTLGTFDFGVRINGSYVLIQSVTITEKEGA